MDVLNKKIAEVELRGFLDIEPEPSLDLFAELRKLKKEKASQSLNWLALVQLRCFAANAGPPCASK